MAVLASSLTQTLSGSGSDKVAASDVRERPRALHGGAAFFKADEGRSVSNPFFLEGRDLPQRIQAHRDHVVLAVGRQRPGQFIGSEILGHRHREDAPLASREEVSRLALVGTSGLDAVVRSNRNIQLLLGVPIEIAQKKTEAAVGILEPSFKRAGDALARFLEVRHVVRRGRLRASEHRGQREPQAEKKPLHHCRGSATRCRGSEAVSLFLAAQRS